MRAILAAALALLATPVAAEQKAETRTAIFAGGCFWCVESDFEKLPGVIEATSGYSGGSLQNPVYENHLGHREAVLVEYDPAAIGYRALVDYFLRHIDPTDDGGQFCDRGHSYTTAIYVADDSEDQAARDALVAAEQEIGTPVVTPVEPRAKFWVAEGYHQNYYKKNKLKYSYYRTACGRDARVKKVWGAKKQ
jgi:peptide-methionine (S)-S-oxide reductase